MLAYCCNMFPKGTIDSKTTAGYRSWILRNKTATDSCSNDTLKRNFEAKKTRYFAYCGLSDPMGHFANAHTTIFRPRNIRFTSPYVHVLNTPAWVSDFSDLCSQSVRLTSESGLQSFRFVSHNRMKLQVRISCSSLLATKFLMHTLKEKDISISSNHLTKINYEI